MLALALLLAQLSPAQLPAVGTDAGELTPLPIVVVNPGNLRTALSNPELFAALSAILRPRTHTLPTLVDGYGGVCRGDLKCLVQEARLEPVLAEASAILWVSSRSSPAGTRVVVSVLDAQRVLKGLRNDAVSSLDLQDVATTTTANHVEVRSAEEAEGLLARVVDVEIAGALKRAGLWGAYGSLTVEGLPAEAWVDLGEGRRRIAPDQPVLTGVRPGVRRVQVEPDGYQVSAAEVTVMEGGVAQVAPRWERLPTFGLYARRATVGVGLGAAVLGGVAWGISTGDAQQVCLTNGVVEGACSPVAPGAATWGSGLIAGGVVMAGGALLLGDDHEVPWLGWVLGVVAGSAAAVAVELAR